MSSKCWRFALMSSLLFLSCLNRYEKKLIGNYEVERYYKTDSLGNESIELPSLKLKPNKTFQLTFKSRLIKGKWKASDYGDFTLIEFERDGKQAQGKIVGTKLQPEIEISIPANFYCPFLTFLVFKKK